VRTVPVRPAAYTRDRDAYPGDESSLTESRRLMVRLAREIGWPEPVVYADAGTAAEPGSQYAALVEAIAAGRHDAVIVTHPMMISRDLAQVEAFDKLCRQHGVRVHSRWGHELANPRSLFDVIRDGRRFTVTDEHLRLLRRAYVSWDETEFGAPEIDCKRPYGNSNVLGDIAEILDIPDSEWADEDMTPLPDAEWRFLRLHVETAIVLQIALATGEFRTGSYTREDKWGHNWKRDEETNA
jgi:hypothetical protein